MTVEELISFLKTVPKKYEVIYLGYGCGSHFTQIIEKDVLSIDKENNQLIFDASWN